MNDTGIKSEKVADSEINANVAAAIEVLYETQNVTLSDGTAVGIKKVTLKTLPKVISLLQAVIGDLTKDGGAGLNAFTNISSDPATVLQLIANHLDEAYAVAAMHCSLSVDELVELDMYDGGLVIAKIVGVNKSFFTQKVLPLINQEVA